MILSIESSCDDSSIAITEIATKKLLFHKKISQELEHSVYGGVVPELASRLHAEALPKILESCREYLPHIKAVAVTNEPGLSVTLVEGVTMAKALCVALKIPLMGVNHLKGHIYSLFIEKEVVFPLTVLLVSGGHTQVIEAEILNKMTTVASTMDDSFGESFDKVAKMMKLGYPGGPVIEKMAKDANPLRYNFTVPLLQNKKIAFSYSGLKNAVRLAVEAGSEEDYPDIAASFQHIATKHLTYKLNKYFQNSPPKRFAIVGGASANLYLRSEIDTLIAPYKAELLLAPLEYCSDNAAMIGRVGIEMYRAKQFTDHASLHVSPRAKL